MVQIKNFVCALLTLSIATCTPIVKRDATTVLKDLTSISTALDTLTASVTAYTGGLIAALAVATNEGTLDTAVKKATTDANAANAFTTSESTSVVAAIAAQVPKIEATLTALTVKEPLFAASALVPLVKSLLQTLQSNAGKLAIALQAKAQPTDVAVLVSGQTTINAAFVAAITAYS